MAEIPVNIFRAKNATNSERVQAASVPAIAEMLRTCSAKFTKSKDDTKLVTFNEYAEAGAGRGLKNIKVLAPTEN